MLIPLIFAVLLHECGHILLLLLTKGSIAGMSMSLFGITLKATYPNSYLSRLAISLGGPFFGILGFLMFHETGGAFSLFADISLGLALFNLLPISFLDGGAALSCLLFLFLSYEKAFILSKGISLFFTLLLWMISIYLFLFLHGSSSLFFLSLWLFFSLFFSKKKKMFEE